MRFSRVGTDRRAVRPNFGGAQEVFCRRRTNGNAVDLLRTARRSVPTPSLSGELQEPNCFT